MGKWWIEERADFVEVTVGTGRMFAIMRGMQHLFAPLVNAQEKAAIFASVPGGDHTLGVRMAADLFRKDGWQIALKIGLDHDELITDIDVNWQLTVRMRSFGTGLALNCEIFER